MSANMLDAIYDHMHKAKKRTSARLKRRLRMWWPGHRYSEVWIEECAKQMQEENPGMSASRAKKICVTWKESLFHPEGWEASSRKKKPKLWMQKATKHPGRLRKLLGIKPGEKIPYEWKNQGCKNPREAFARLIGRIPSKQEASSFQKMMCLARTYEERGGRKRKVVTARRAA